MTIRELVCELNKLPQKAEIFISVSTPDGKLVEKSVKGLVYSQGEIELTLKES